MSFYLSWPEKPGVKNIPLGNLVQVDGQVYLTTLLTLNFAYTREKSSFMNSFDSANTSY